MKRLAAAAAGLALGWAMLHAADWPTYRADYARSGVSADPIPATVAEAWTWRSAQRPRPAWQGEAKWDGWNKVYDLKPRQIFDRAFHVVLAGNRVYFGSSADDQVRCLDAVTGLEQWTFHTEGPVRLAPTVHQGRLYFGSDDGCVYCLKADSGDLIWKTRATPKDRRIPGNGRLISVWPVRTSLVVQDGKVFTTAGMFPSEGVHLVAFDALTGAEVWRQIQTDLPAQGYLLASRSRLYVPAGRDNPAVCDLQDGKRLRVVEGSGGTYALLADDQLVFGPGKTGQLGAVEDGHSDQLATFQGNHMIVTPKRSYLHSDRELTALDRGRFLELARERKRLSGQQGALVKKLKALEKKNGAEAERETVKAQLADLGKRMDEATQGMDRCQIWRAESSWPNCLILGGDLLVAGGQDEVAALRAVDGGVAWKHKVEGRAYGLATANGRVLVSTDEGVIHCLRDGGTQAASPRPDSTSGNAQ